MKKFIVLVLILLLAMTMLTACGSREIDKEALAVVKGEYQAVEFDNGNDDDYIGPWWHLSIIQDSDEYGNYLTINDNHAGNPGVEGEIVLIDETNIKIKIDPEYYDQLPSYHWQDSGDYLELTYAMTAEGIELSNNGTAINFIFDQSEIE